MNNTKKLTGLWVGKLGDANSWYHIFPFASADRTNKLHVVRRSPPFYEVPNSFFYHYKSKNPITEFFKLYLYGRKIIKTNRIDYIVTFNPYPWGIAAWVLSKQFNIPVSVGLIGKDFDIGLKKSVFKSFLRNLIRKSDYVTITGNAMRPYLEKIGVKSDRIGIYPHCIKDDWFENENNIATEYDIVTVCELIERKKVEDIIESIHILKQKGISASCCIVGDGPMMKSLAELVNKLQLSNLVTFTGYKKDVLNYIKRSRIYVQASRQEGLSISLIEAMVAGLVPVSTIAGSEEDIIEDGKNGFFVQIGRPNEIADKIEFLMDKNNYESCRRKVLETRDRFRMNIAIETANRIIEKLTLN